MSVGQFELGNSETATASQSVAHMACLRCGGHLARPASVQDNQLIKAYLAGLASTANLAGLPLSEDPHYWMDLTYSSDGQWKYSNGETPTFTDWYPGQPNGLPVDGAVIYHGSENFEWASYPGTGSYPYVCQRPL